MRTSYTKLLLSRLLTALVLVMATLVAVGVGTDIAPAKALAFSGFTQVAAGDGFSCAVKSDSTVWCWGVNTGGALGDGTTTARTKPVQVVGITDATQVIAGEWFGCALKSNGTVACWGSNSFGQLGNGNTTNSALPLVVAGLSEVTQISGNYGHVCARLSDSTARCWGWNVLNQLGNGSTASSSTPVTPSNLTGVIQISAGVFGTCARLADKTVRCWGAGNNGGLGDGTSTYSTSTKTSPTGLSDVASISAGPGWGNECAILVNGTLKCWGLNNVGQIGIGVYAESGSDYWRLIPVTVSGFAATVLSVDVGIYTPCAVLANTTAMCWGGNGSGNAGDGTTAIKSVPTLVSGLSGVTQISAGYYHSCAVLTDTTVKCWGRNQFGALGNGTTTNSNTAVSVIAPPVTLGIPLEVTARATASTVKSIDVSWGASANAVSYSAKIYNSTGTTLIATKTGITGTSTAITAATYSAIADNTSYKVSVTAIGDGGNSFTDSSESPLVVVTTNLNAATPIISVHPTTNNKTAGQSVTMSVTASTSDSGTLSYQWKKGGSTISNEISNSLILTPIVAGDAGSYTVVVTNTISNGVSSAVTSNAGVLSVAAALTIATPTTGLSGTANSAFSLAVPGVGGRTALSYALTGTLVNGLSLSTTTGTISGTPTVAGSSSVSVTVTDANNATASTSGFTISIAYASTTVSLALANSSPQYRITNRITATTSRAGTVNFMLGGVSITGCSAVAAASTTAVCDWVPIDLGIAALSATFTPTASTAYSYSTSSLSPTVSARAITVTPTSGLTKVFGESDPVFTYTITSGSLDVLDALNGSLSRTQGNDVGTYSVTGGTLSNANYVITLTPVNFAITKANQVTVLLTSTGGIYATDLELVASGGSGTGAYSYVVTTSGTANCSIVNGSLRATSPGTCTVTVTRAASTNYFIKSSSAMTVTFAKQNQISLAISTTSGDLYTGIIIATTGGSGTGLITSSVTSGTADCNITSGVVTAKVAGTCSVTVTKAADATFASESVTALLTFSKAVPATGRLGTGTSGTAGSEITLSFTGGSGTGSVSYSVASSGTARCTIANGKLTASSAGTCSVTTTKQGDDVYPDQTVTTEFTFTAGQLATPQVETATASTTSTTTTTTTVAPVAGTKRAIVTTTTTTSTTSTTEAPKPLVAPKLVNTDSASGASTIGGKTVRAKTTRVNNQLVFTAGGFTVTLAGVNPDGSVIPLTSEGLLEVRRGDTFRLDATGFAPGSLVDIWMFSKTFHLTQMEVGPDGLVRSSLKVPKSITDGLHHLVMVGVDKANAEAKFEVGMNVGVPAKQWWYSRVLLAIPISFAVFAGFWLPTTARRKRRRTA